MECIFYLQTGLSKQRDKPEKHDGNELPAKKLVFVLGPADLGKNNFDLMNTIFATLNFFWNVLEIVFHTIWLVCC